MDSLLEENSSNLRLGPDVQCDLKVKILKCESVQLHHFVFCLLCTLCFMS
jgi:hypothetical protein